jgi:hypothetical protein
MLTRLAKTTRNFGSKIKLLSPSQYALPFAFGIRFNLIPDDWQQMQLDFVSKRHLLGRHGAVCLVD